MSRSFAKCPGEMSRWFSKRPGDLADLKPSREDPDYRDGGVSNAYRLNNFEWHFLSLFVILCLQTPPLNVNNWCFTYSSQTLSSHFTGGLHVNLHPSLLLSFLLPILNCLKPEPRKYRRQIDCSPSSRLYTYKNTLWYLMQEVLLHHGVSFSQV